MRFALVKSVDPTSPRRQSQQAHFRQSSCQNWSRAFSRYLSRIGFWQAAQLTLAQPNSPAFPTVPTPTQASMESRSLNPYKNWKIKSLYFKRKAFIFLIPK
ncbi:uncharacterized protein CEXT_222791 [Caerostris extrusa]|uniref:Uncharacterized protein n=1 Tax=Caerostris extrusa TaxID=172846 RepID=A0AAV4NL89_CAEEX|nr:uncharacterized protein CEXT_222791 [Caerostris extrusa]